MGNAHVVPDERRMPRDGRPHGRPLQRPDARGERNRLPRAGREEAYLLYEPPDGTDGGDGFHLLQRGPHGRERPVQSQRREGHEAHRAVSRGGDLSGLPRKQALGGRPRSQSAGHRTRRGRRYDAVGAHPLGQKSARFTSRAHTPDGGQHLRVFPGHLGAPDGPRTGLPGLGPGSFHALHR